MARRRIALALLGLGLGCSPADSAPTGALAPSTAPAKASSPPRAVISVIGTNDLHGRVHALPLLAGYVSRLRAVREKDGGVVLLDAGDMFQGTLESNLSEGLPVVAAYAAMGYDAVTIGNHEFDFGPVGPAATAEKPGDDPRGALKAAAAAAPFPFLTANVEDKSTSRPLEYPNVAPSTLVEVAGAKVGLIGVTTEETLTTTISANVKDLTIAPLAGSIAKEASRLRQAGASAIVVLAHAGGKCKTFTHDPKVDQCEERGEIFRVAKALPPGAVDVIVAGHTHAGVAHQIEGVAIIEQYAYGRAFGRVDLVIEDGKLVEKTVFAPRDLCPAEEMPDFASCSPGDYEGGPVTRDPKVTAAVQPAIDGAQSKRAERLGADLPEGLGRDYDDESALGNLFADLVREWQPGVDVGLMNGGGLRADLPRGPLSYGSLFEAFPFDNRLAVAELDGKRFRELVRRHLQRGGGILSFSGVVVRASCKGTELAVTVSRDGKRPVGDDEKLTVMGSDFLFTGGDDFWGGAEPPPVRILDTLMRDALESGLRKRASVMPQHVFDPKKPRLSLSSRRPIDCKR